MQRDATHEVVRYQTGPNGQMQLIEAWCVTRPDGRVFLHVPAEGLEITPGAELPVMQALFKALVQR
jgi:hypothetical protein